MSQLVILGAWLGTFAQRRTDVTHLRIFEVDEPETQRWKQEPLPIPECLRFVPLNLESGEP